MADTPHTSFIPKQSMGSVPGRAARRPRHFNIFSFLGVVVLLCSLILAVGVFIYKDFSERDLEREKQELQEQKGSFSQSDIESLRELDRRITVTRALLDQHLAPSVVFDVLERRTQQSIQLTDFSYERRESGSVEVVIGGTALRFNTIALQNRELAAANLFSNAVFSDMNVTDLGTVTFVVTGQVNTGMLAFDPALPAAPAPESEDDGTAATSTATGEGDGSADVADDERDANGTGADAVDDAGEPGTISDDVPSTP